MSKLFEIPELLTLGGSPYTQRGGGREVGEACKVGCEGGCESGCASGGGVDDKEDPDD